MRPLSGLALLVLLWDGWRWRRRRSLRVVVVVAVALAVMTVNAIVQDNAGLAALGGLATGVHVAEIIERWLRRASAPLL